ncbi:MAG TPA: hypothetical protein VD794_03490 [Flavisolibacter sp.]|nr:hypothetical protein [Flavisolibacter sp.]
MNKYLVTILFEWTDEMNELLSEHQTFINTLIEDLVVEHYAVSMEVQTAWVTINANTKEDVEAILSVSPFYKFWTLEIRELIVWDGLSYRLPALQLN